MEVKTLRISTELNPALLDCKITNTQLFGEMIDNHNIMAYGKYDLILCYSVEGGEGIKKYLVLTSSQNICEKLPMLWDHNWLNKYGYTLENTKIQVSLNQPSGVRLQAVAHSSNLIKIIANLIKILHLWTGTQYRNKARGKNYCPVHRS